jgi:hypothetical protein
VCTLSPLAIADLGGCKGRDEGNARGQGNSGAGLGEGRGHAALTIRGLLQAFSYGSRHS